jgi:hypothetical protein
MGKFGQRCGSISRVLAEQLWSPVFKSHKSEKKKKKRKEK